MIIFYSALVLLVAVLVSTIKSLCDLIIQLFNSNVGVSLFPPSSYQYRLLQSDKIAIKLNTDAIILQNLCAESSKISKIICAIIKITIF